MKKCYKVVKRENNKLVSCVVTGQAEITYELGKWIKAPKWLRNENKGPLVFETSNKASDFVHDLAKEGLEIWECQYRGEIKDFSYLSLTGLSTGELCAAYFNNFPQGTMQVKQVKLIRKIENEDML